MPPPPLRLVAPVAPAPQFPARERLGERLVRAGAVRPMDVDRALADHHGFGVPLGRVLRAQGRLGETELADHLAAQHDAVRLDPRDDPPDGRLVDEVGLETCLALRILPWRRVGGALVVATADPDGFDAVRGALETRGQRVLMAIMTEADLADGLARVRPTAMTRRAEGYSPAGTSCRGRSVPRLARRVLLIGLAAGAALWAWPLAAGLALLGLLAASLAAGTLLKLWATWQALRAPLPDTVLPSWKDVPLLRLPEISILVPLYREQTIAARLIRRLERLDYPRPLLDICLVVEAGDDTTMAALEAAAVPGWMRAVTVPRGTIKTKPRALNYALDFCRGSLIGIYDAEDAPAPDQLRRVVQRFHLHGPELACVQGRLGFYNSTTNWLARCFTVEYATWFRVILPALARLGWPVPLGGTTLFLRREALEALGRWDAHNVTEDAELGLRIARAGYRTVILDSLTEEEANCRAWPWVRQRSRWLKGYAMTYGAHMRAPRQLWRDLGGWGVLGVQVIYGGALLQVTAAPLLWSFWALALGLPHPLAEALPPAALYGLIALMIAAEAATLLSGLAALRDPDLRHLRPWVPTLHVYFMLATLAAAKALGELLFRPYYWDKTVHGLFDIRAPARTVPKRGMG